MKNKSPLFIIHYALYILLIISCSTQPQSGNLTGTIHLSGEVEHNDITVALYELSELDPDIVAINEEYDFIGVIINQTTEFDHRFANLIKYKQTDANGNFKIKDIPTGRYNFMAMKDSFGFRYIYEVSITEGDNELNSLKTKEQRPKIKEKNLIPKLYKNDFNLSYNFSLSSLVFSLNNRSVITLFPETHISTDIDTSTTWHSSRHYIIEPEFGDNITISGSLTIKPGAVIRIEKDKKLTISGDLIAVGNEDNFIWFTSNDGLDSLISIYPYIPYTFNRVELTVSEAKQVAWCKFDHAGTGLLNRVNGFSISDCIFRNSSCGFKSENVDSTFCSNLLCENITNESEAGIYFINVDSGIIEENVTNYCKIGIQIKNGSSPIVKNNYINNSTHSVDISWNSYPDIFYNVLKNSETAISVTRSSCPNIFNNNINAGIGVIRGHYSGTISMDIHHNNLNCSNYSIYLKENHNYSGCGIDVNAENNYFYTTNEDEIQASIHDKNDIEPSQQQYYGIVYYDPPLGQEYPYAGIQGE